MAKYIDITTKNDVSHITVSHIVTVQVTKTHPPQRMTMPFVKIYTLGTYSDIQFRLKDNDTALQARNDIIEAMVTNTTEDHMDIITVRLDITKYQEPSK